MRASTCQIYVGGKLVLQAKNLTYMEKRLRLTGFAFVGTVGKVVTPTQAADVLAMLQGENVKNLEIRIDLI